MITLDPTSYEVASNMKNFSGWVRTCLKAIHEGEDLAAAIRQRAFWRERCSELECQILVLNEKLEAARGEEE